VPGPADHDNDHDDDDDDEVTEPRWWELRRAQNLKPATYTCPLCGRRLQSMSDHVLLFPEGDHSQRRHAHTDCVRRAREAGRLPSRSEWKKSQPRRRWLRRPG
jgi:hypothetical protein